MNDPICTDFSTWERSTLERFAREAADENKQLRQDIRAALDGYRALVLATCISKIEGGTRS